MDDYKKKHIKSRLQAALFGEDGSFVQSCNTLFALDQSSRLFANFPFLREHKGLISKLQEGVFRRFNQVEFQADGRHFIGDVSVGKEKNQVCIVIEDLTDLYRTAGHQSDSGRVPSDDEQMRKELEALKTMQRIKQDQFSQITHDIKLPLTEIIGTTYLLKHHVSDEKGIAYLNCLTQAARNLDTMLNDLVSFSRNEAFQLRVDSKSFDLKQLLESVVRSFDFKALTKDVPVKLEIDPLIPEKVIGDPSRLSQIIHNLVDNALKFTSEGSVLLNLKVLEKDSDNLVVLFTISDTGIGIPMDKLSSIFETYRRVRSSESDAKGFGIGLSIVKQLVELQNGKISAESQLGQGTTFKVELPFEQVYR